MSIASVVSKNKNGQIETMDSMESMDTMDTMDTIDSYIPTPKRKMVLTKSGIAPLALAVTVGKMLGSLKADG